MSVSVVATGKGHWEDYVKPMIDSILKYEPECDIVIVDAGDEWPKEYRGVEIIKAAGANCQVGQNIAMKARPNADWYLVCDVDVICHDKFIDDIGELDTDTIWGNKFQSPSTYNFDTMKRWIDGWIYAIPRRIVDDIGYFDVHFKASGFEDADYCWRAMDAGYSIGNGFFRFEHKEAGVKRGINKDYDELRRYNIQYLMAKHGIEYRKKGARE